MFVADKILGGGNIQRRSVRPTTSERRNRSHVLELLVTAKDFKMATLETPDQQLDGQNIGNVRREKLFENNPSSQ